MTTISIVASGSRGDVQPYVALGHGLKQAGYHVRLLSSENFAGLVQEGGLEFVSIGESVESVIETDEWRKTIASGNFIRILAKMQAEMKKRAVGMAEIMPQALRPSDLIMTGMAGMGGTFSIAEKYNIPVLQAFVFPFSPTQAFPAPLVPKLPLGKLLNRPSFHIVRQLFWQNSKATDVAIRKILGMSKPPFWGYYAQLDRQKVPLLYGYSQHVLPRPQDWAQHESVTGYWFLDAPASWTPPTDLQDFLQDGTPPVYIGFGSMKSDKPEEGGAIALEALERAGQRGILSAGWGGLKPSHLPKTVHMVSSLPHSWLFPRMGAVVHHGGAGTTAASLRAGVPSIIVPFMGDQPFWGKRVADMGVGPAPIPRKKLTSENLAHAISQAMSNATMRQNARLLGEKINAENGIANAVKAIKNHLGA
jgi:sterol 3beta-glucosyltransferase